MSTESYNTGYQTGLHWKDNYRPGGPWVCRPRPYDDETKLETCRKSQEDHDDWMQGFDDGLEAQRTEK